MAPEAEILVVRSAAGAQDIDSAAQILKSSSIREIAEEQADEPGSVQLLLRDGAVAGALVHRRESWEVGRATLKVARVWEVSGASGQYSFRNTGNRLVFDTLLSKWCEYIREAGYHLAYAHGELGLWPVHGFYPCFFHPRVYVPTSKALKLKKRYKVRGVKTSDARPMSRLMAEYRHLRPRVFATGVPDFHHYAVEGPGRRVHGYFSMRVTDEPGEPPVFIPEVAVRNREAAETILAHAAPSARELGMKALHFALAKDHPFARVCLDLGGYFQLRGSTRDITLDEEMVRVASVGAVLEILADELWERLRQAGLTEVPESVMFDVEGEKAALRRTEEGFEVAYEIEPALTIRLPRWAFTQLLMGYRTPFDLRQGTVQPVRAMPLLTAMFPKTWPISLCDHDLWDSTLRDSKKYSPEALREIRKLRYPF